MIGIAGGSGSGKTTFTEKIQSRLNGNVSVLHMDSYYLPTPPKHLCSKSSKPNFDHPEAFDWDLLKLHLGQLKNGESIESPVYDFKSNSRTQDTERVEATSVVLFEGIFSLYDPAIRELLEIMCFLHVDADIRFTRRLHRDVQERGRSMDSVIAQYYETVRPMYMKFLDPQKQYADFIVGEETDIAASILAAKINELLEYKGCHDPSAVGLQRFGIDKQEDLHGA
ncbi:MAG: uridine kinase [Bdellovibrionales bacterium CG12_big_fil_rev_8_21_14_0_65_38_15]|nr:MAG: uridine kinase [Bdellovibrionales bacterium CG12_big_fil_rev_8_21_14_0_65_38_15]